MRYLTRLDDFFAADIVFSIVDLHSLTSALDTAGHSDGNNLTRGYWLNTPCLIVVVKKIYEAYFEHMDHLLLY